MRVDHVGYLVQDIEAACIAFLQLGFSMQGTSTPIHDRLRRILILFLKNSSSCVELV